MFIVGLSLIIIAVMAVIIVNMYGFLQRKELDKKQSLQKHLELIALHFNGEEIEVEFLNKSNETYIIEKAEISIKKVWVNNYCLRERKSSTDTKPYYTSDSFIPLAAPYKTQIKLDAIIQPNAITRFPIKLSTDNRNYFIYTNLKFFNKDISFMLSQNYIHYFNEYERDYPELNELVEVRDPKNRDYLNAVSLTRALSSITEKARLSPSAKTEIEHMESLFLKKM